MQEIPDLDFKISNLKSQDSGFESSSIHHARSFGYGLIAEAFRWPTAELMQEWCNLAQWSVWPDILQAIYPETAEHFTHLRQSVSTAPSLGELESDYIRLFGHTVRGACPLYELEYGQSEIIQQASSLADIGGFYAAFGLMSTTDCQERQDHLCVESEFMRILTAQEAHAAETGDPDGREIVRGAERMFLGDHLGRWLPACMRRVCEAAPECLYGMVARFAGCFVAAECRALDVKIGPELLDLRSVEPTADVEIRCGVEESCPGSRDDELVQINLSRPL